MSTKENKAVVAAAKKVLKELGHDVPTGHLYELFSKLGGANSWNVASAKGAAFAQVEGVRPTEDIVAGLAPDQKVFSVKISTENERKCVKYYQINAASEAEALAFVREYVNVRTGEIEEKDAKLSGTKLLLEAEDESDFDYANWSVEDSTGYVPEIEHATELGEKEAKDAVRSYLFMKKTKTALRDYEKA